MIGSSLDALLALRLASLEFFLHGGVLVSHAQVLILLLLSLLLQIFKILFGRRVVGHNLVQVLDLLLQVGLGLEHTLVLNGLLDSLMVTVKETANAIVRGQSH